MPKKDHSETPKKEEENEQSNHQEEREFTEMVEIEKHIYKTYEDYKVLLI
jgi:hypothetical protein